jgi:hypothetical protein
MENSTHLLLTVGSVFLVTWYGVSRLRIDRSRRFGLPGELRDFRVAAATAVRAEFRQAAESHEMYPGGFVVCNHCGIEYPAGIAFCDCGHETVEAEDMEEASAPVLPTAGETPDLEEAEDLVCIHVAENCWQASLLKSYLETHDIPCATGGQIAPGAYQFSVTPLSEVRLYVHTPHASRARQLLKECISD